ncbi:MAG: NAD-dependent epimerase/dehydratase family protein [Syntrophaceae bacterium]|nr:NAD-dependent epimerase/dehydratase family protein [Syntrophaceae bacterium]
MNLITGGSGFIGINIARQLLSRGEGVRILDLAAPEGDLPRGRWEFVRADVRDRERVIEACRGVRRVFHIAALVPISKAGRAFWDVNVGGTKNVLDGALRHGVSKVLHMSSSAVLGVRRPSPLDETAALDPIGVYARSKADGEALCLDYRTKGLDISIVRPRTVIGPGRLGIFSILFDWVRAGKTIYLIGPGTNRIQFVEVSELADACIRIAERASNDLFHIGTDRFGTLRDDLGALTAHAGSRSRIRSIPAALAIPLLRALDAMRLSPLADWHYYTYHKDFFFDVAKARTQLGWQPRLSNAEALAASYDWYAAHLDAAHRKTGTTHRAWLRQGILRLLRGVS